MTRNHLLTATTIVFLVSAFCPAGALTQQPMPIAGMLSGTQQVFSSIDLQDGRTIQRILFSVGVTADDHSHPFHLGNQDCLATYVFSADDELIGGRGVCDLVSPDGDIYSFEIEASGTDPARWRGLGGTGRFAGIEASGTTVISAEWTDGKVIGRWEGTMIRR